MSTLQQEREYSHVKERIDVIAPLAVDPVPRDAASQEKPLHGPLFNPLIDVIIYVHLFYCW